MDYRLCAIIFGPVLTCFGGVAAFLYTLLPMFVETQSLFKFCCSAYFTCRPSFFVGGILFAISFAGGLKLLKFSKSYNALLTTGDYSTSDVVEPLGLIREEPKLKIVDMLAPDIYR